MKRKLHYSFLMTCITFIGFINIQTASAQWLWQNPTPQGNNLYGLSFINADTGTAVGYGGSIIRTTNGGDSWNVQPSGVTRWLIDVSFVDANNGTAVGGYIPNISVILHTTDGGANWIAQSSGVAGYHKSVSFSDVNHGTVVGSGGKIIHTTDGGANWILQTSGTTNLLNCVKFVDNNIGTVVGANGTILHTTDGGANWVLQTSGTTASLNSISFIDQNTATIVGSNATILRTNDGGANWIAQTCPFNAITIYGVSFSDANNGIAVGETTMEYGGTIMKTTDGGANWEIQSSGIATTLTSVSLSDVNNGIIVGWEGTILQTTNGGTNWNLKSGGTKNDINAVSFSDNYNGGAVGTFGTIVHTNDAGVNWTIQTSGTEELLKGISYSNANTGTVVGQSGIILHTTNGGINWNIQSSGVNTLLTGVSFTDDNNGTAVGMFGTIVHTSNGGANWSLQTSGTTENLNGVCFTDANNGTAVGYNGIILRTTNGGVNWNAQTSGTTLQLNGVSFVDANTGTAVGYNGKILRTTDGGLNWSTQTSGTTKQLNGVSFTDANNGIVVGANAVILRTTNGGTNWTLEPNGTISHLLGVDAIDTDNAVVVGGLGSILRWGTPPLLVPAAFAITGGGAYCQGSEGLPVGLSDSEVDVTYTLYKDGIAQVPTVAGTGSAISFGNQLAGTYIVSGTNITGGTTEMTGSAVITETVALPVSVSVEVDQNNVCAGTPVTFTATPVNGGNPAYQWYQNGSPAGSNQATFSYIPENNDQIYVVLTSDLACVSGNPATSNSIAMVVNTAVTASISIEIDQNNICEGTPATFTATPTEGGDSPVYQWFVNGIENEATGAVLTYVPANNDEVYVLLTSSITCVTNNPVQSNTIQLSVSETVDVIVSIAEDQNNICEGNTMTFTASTTNGGDQPTYSWFVDENNLGENAPTFSYIPVNGDIISLVFTSSEWCVSQNPVTSNAVVAIVNALPEVTWNYTDPTTVCIEDWGPITLTGGLPEGGVYSGDGVSGNIFNQAVAGVGNHIISYTYTDANNCSNQATMELFVDECLGVTELSSGLLVYPNPASNYLTIRLTDNQTILDITLFNNMGIAVYENHDVKSMGATTIPVLHLQAGNYIIKVTGNNETLIKPVIIE
jgi:photosystem II stability/assembly factor-like uncharacterized protein